MWSLREGSSIDSRGQDTPRGGRSCAEKAKEAARTRDRQAAASQDDAEENDATEEEMTRERTTRVSERVGVWSRDNSGLSFKEFAPSLPTPLTERANTSRVAVLARSNTSAAVVLTVNVPAPF